jgi:hypothetical protein
MTSEAAADTSRKSRLPDQPTAQPLSGLGRNAVGNYGGGGGLGLAAAVTLKLYEIPAIGSRKATFTVLQLP